MFEIVYKVITVLWVISYLLVGQGYLSKILGEVKDGKFQDVLWVNKPIMHGLKPACLLAMPSRWLEI